MTKKSKTIYWKDVLVVAVSVVLGIQLQRPFSDFFEICANNIIGVASGGFLVSLVSLIAMAIAMAAAIVTIMFAIYILARARGYELR